MRVFMMMIMLSCASLAFPASNGFQQDAKRNTNDVLNPFICIRLRERELCKSNVHIKKTLCKSTCNCDDILARRSCKVLKGLNECSKNLAVRKRYCKSTCGFCHATACKKSEALGMQSKAIPDSRITASSSWSKSYGPFLGRLHSNKAWVTRHNRVGIWFQVDLGRIKIVQGIATQERKLDSKEWVKSYSLQYSNNGKTFKNYQGGKVFKGNKDRNAVVKNDLYPPIAARYIRLVVKSWHSHTSMRMELYGCKI